MDGRVRERSASQARSDADADARARAHGLTQEAVRHRAAPCSNRCVHTAPAGTVPSLRRQRHPPAYLGFEGADAEDEVLRELRLVHVQHMDFERANQRLPCSTLSPIRLSGSLWADRTKAERDGRSPWHCGTRALRPLRMCVPALDHPAALRSLALVRWTNQRGFDGPRGSGTADGAGPDWLID